MKPAGDKDENENEEAGSTFYASDRIARSNEAWDTIDPRLVKSLVEAIPSLKNRVVWEPAAGCGTMVDQLKAAGVKVDVATDIEPRRDDIAKLDLLAATEMMPGTDAIVTNPPWGRLAAPFVRKALELAEARRALAAMLLPLPWIAGAKIADLTSSPGFQDLVVPRYRARWMTDEEEAELDDGPSNPKMNHAWLLWDFARDPDLLPAVRFVDAPSEGREDEAHPDDDDKPLPETPSQ
jgi:predicted RNA methylase